MTPLPTIETGERDLTLEAHSAQDLEALAEVDLLRRADGARQRGTHKVQPSEGSKGSDNEASGNGHRLE